MIADIDLTGIAALLTGVAVIIAASAGAYATVKSTKTIRETHRMVTQVDSAVNGKNPGETTMVSQVQDMHDKAFPPVEIENGGDAMLPLLRRLVVEMEEHRRRAELHKGGPDGP